MFQHIVVMEYRYYFVRFEVFTVASMKFRIVFWDVLPWDKIIPDDGGSTRH
jgi:hypothetical protein